MAVREGIGEDGSSPASWGGRRVLWQRRRWGVPDALWAVGLSVSTVLPVVVPPAVTGRQLISWTRGEATLASLVGLTGSGLLAAWSTRRFHHRVGRPLCCTLWCITAYMFVVFSSLTAPRAWYPVVMMVGWPAVPMIPACWAHTSVAMIDEWSFMAATGRRQSERVVLAWLVSRSRALRIAMWGRRVECPIWWLVVWIPTVALILLGEIPGVMVSGTLSDDGPWLGWGYHAHALYVIVAVTAEGLFLASAVVVWGAWRIRAPVGVHERLFMRWAPVLATLFAILAALLFAAAGLRAWPEAFIDALVLPSLLAYSAFLLSEGAARATRRALYILRKTCFVAVIGTATLVAVVEMTAASRWFEGCLALLLATGYGRLAPMWARPSPLRVRTPMAEPPAHVGARRSTGAGAPSGSLGGASTVGESALSAARAGRDSLDVETTREVGVLLTAPIRHRIPPALLIVLARSGVVLREIGLHGHHLLALLDPVDRPGKVAQRAIPAEPLRRLLDEWQPLQAYPPHQRRDVLLELIYETASARPVSVRDLTRLRHPPGNELVAGVCLQLHGGPFSVDEPPEHQRQHRQLLIHRLWALGRDVDGGPYPYGESVQEADDVLRRYSGRRVLRGAPGESRGVRPTDRSRECQRYYDRQLEPSLRAVIRHWLERCDEAAAQIADT